MTSAAAWSSRCCFSDAAWSSRCCFDSVVPLGGRRDAAVAAARSARSDPIMTKWAFPRLRQNRRMLRPRRI